MADKKEKKNEVDPFANQLLETRTIMITGEINKEMAAKVIEQLLILDSKEVAPISIYINSPGGDVDAGFAIYDTIRFVSSEVTLIGCGLVASAAALIILAVDKDHRVGFPHSTYLIHQPLSGMKGVATDIEIHAKQVEKLRYVINAIIAKETNKDVEEVAQHTDRDYWLTSIEAVEYGLISKIVEKKSDL